MALMIENPKLEALIYQQASLQNKEPSRIVEEMLLQQIHNAGQKNMLMMTSFSEALIRFTSDESQRELQKLTEEILESSKQVTLNPQPIASNDLFGKGLLEEMKKQGVVE
jgi:preprotein translocase subunit Sec63